MLKKTKHFELIDLFIIMAIIIILAALIAPNIITSIQKSKQENIMKDSTIIHADIIKKIKAGKKNFDIFIQGIMGVNKAEKEFAEATEIYKKRHPEYLGRTKPWERNDSNLNNSGLREKKAGMEVSNVKKN